MRHAISHMIATSISSAQTQNSKWQGATCQSVTSNYVVTTFGRSASSKQNVKTGENKTKSQTAFSLHPCPKICRMQFMWIIVDSCSSTFSKIHETYMWVSVISYDCDQWTSLTKDGLTAARPLGPSYWHRNHHKSLLGFEKSKFSKLGTPCHDGHDACVRPFDWIILGKKRDRLEWYHTVYMSLQFDICLLLCTYEVHIFVQAKSFQCRFVRRLGLQAERSQAETHVTGKHFHIVNSRISPSWNMLR